MYIFTPVLVHREIDNFVNGCDPDSSITKLLNDHQKEVFTVQNETLKGLLNDIEKLFKVDTNSLLIDSCQEIGRLDVQTYTRGCNGFKCSYNTYKTGFKKGEFDLYLNNITGSVILKVEKLNLTNLLIIENNSK